MGERGRIDHFGFMVRDEAELRTVADRLRASGATDGEIRRLGPVLSVHVTDPDGLEVEINCPDLDFDLARAPPRRSRRSASPTGWQRMRAAVLVAPTSPT